MKVINRDRHKGRKGQEMKNEEKIVSLLEEIKNILKGQKAVVSRFINNGDGTVTDPETGLMWGKTFPQEMNWKDADQACKDLNFAGYKDWRLPTVKELFSIVDHTKGAGDNEPAIDIAFFPDTKCSRYWTSTPTAWDTSGVWCVGFGSGGVATSGKGSRNYVRPVRSSK